MRGCGLRLRFTKPDLGCGFKPQPKTLYCSVKRAVFKHQPLLRFVSIALVKKALSSAYFTYVAYSVGKGQTAIPNCSKGGSGWLRFSRTMYRKPTTKKAIAIAVASIAAAAPLVAATSDIYPSLLSGVRAHNDDHNRRYL